MNNKIVITGVGLISAYGDKFDEFLNNIYEQKNSITNITLFDTKRYPCNLAGEISGFNAETYLGKKGLRNMDRSTKLLLTASQLAMADSQYLLKGQLDEEIGLVIGNTFGSLKSICDFDKTTILEGPSAVSPINFANCVINSAAGYAGIKFQAMCVNLTLSNGISSSLDSLGYAYDFIHNDKADMLLVGGVEEFCEELFYGFLHSKLLATPKNAAYMKGPFNRCGEGVILGEGSAMFTLEPANLAQERNAKAYAEMLGYGRTFNDGTNPQESFARCMEKAIKDAGIDISEIDVVIASANGYMEGDCCELSGLEQVFATYPGTLPVTSIKGHIGECYSSSGAFQVAAGIGMFMRDEIPAVAHCEDCMVVSNKLEIVRGNLRKPVNTVLINSFGFAGSNTCVVLKKHG